MGGVIFVDLRDREGGLQIVFNAANLSRQDFALAEGLRTESVIAVSGRVRIRDEETVNPKLPTGTVELGVVKAELLSEAQPLPFVLEDGANVREELRLKYRFLDIRRPAMVQNLRFRQRTQRAVQRFLDERDFIEVETPILTKSTPEGARDYLVPSRLHPGTFYALPQSPQIFKQLLMVGGIDRYYQIARCFRDEDLRADRQPEFTQVDMEMSFVEQEDVLRHLEDLFKSVFQTVMGTPIAEPFPRLTWLEAMDRYGSDKPDLRFGLPIVDLTDIALSCSFDVFRRVADGGGAVRAINARGCADFTRTTIEELTRKAQGYGAKGMAWIAIRPDGEVYSILTKYLTPKELEAIVRAVEGRPGDFILFCADTLPTVRRVLGGLRLELGDMLGLRSKTDFKFLFVTDFPMFEYSEEEKRFVAMHHPFTMPYAEDMEFFNSDPARVRAQSYDVVLNGIELGSGSIRIHRKDIQQRVFEALGFSPEEIQNRFGFMINAFQYGTPPHGGFAFGLDRLVMLLVGADSLREVIAFPKIRDASCPMTDAPDTVDEAQLAILHLGQSPERDHKGAGGQKGRPAPQIDVDNVAHLARLSLSETEKAAMAEEMMAIVAFADQLGGIDTEGVPPTAHVIPMQNVFRKDEVRPSFDRELLLAATPTREEGYLYVPRVVE
jgi:aspartyl-tRNA synthetase